MNDFQTLAIGDGEAGIQRREAFATKLRKAKKSDILKSKRDELKRKSAALTEELATAETAKNAKENDLAEEKKESEPAVDMSELF